MCPSNHTFSELNKNSSRNHWNRDTIITENDVIFEDFTYRISNEWRFVLMIECLSYQHRHSFRTIFTHARVAILTNLSEITNYILNISSGFTVLSLNKKRDSDRRLSLPQVDERWVVSTTQEFCEDYASRFLVILRSETTTDPGWKKIISSLRCYLINRLLTSWKMSKQYLASFCLLGRFRHQSTKRIY